MFSLLLLLERIYLQERLRAKKWQKISLSILELDRVLDSLLVSSESSEERQSLSRYSSLSIWYASFNLRIDSVDPPASGCIDTAWFL